MASMNDLQDLLVDQLRDLYNAESQLVKALPKMAKAATHPELRSAFEEHLDQTRTHIDRLSQVFDSLGEKAKGKTCQAMKGLIEEGNEVLKEKGADPDVRDAALIAAAQRIEHYEIAGYGTVRTYAKMLGHKDAMKTLQETLNEEGQTDKKLTKLAVSTINVDAESDEQRERASSRGTGRKSAGSRRMSRRGT